MKKFLRFINVCEIWQNSGTGELGLYENYRPKMFQKHKHIKDHNMANTEKTQKKDQIVVRFSGDSGDGMQLAGSIFSTISATVGNDICTFPDYPADIRAPQGVLTGVSGFQVHVGADKVHTPGDKCDILVAMNPAAHRSHYHRQRLFHRKRPAESGVQDRRPHCGTRHYMRGCTLPHNITLPGDTEG